MEEIHIRKLNIKDTPKLRAFLSIDPMYSGKYYNKQERLQWIQKVLPEIERGERDAFGAFEKDLMVGLVLAKEKGDASIVLKSFMVEVNHIQTYKELDSDESTQSLEVRRKLLRKLLDHYSNKTHYSLDIRVPEDNVDLLASIKKLGFSQTTDVNDPEEGFVYFREPVKSLIHI